MNREIHLSITGMVQRFVTINPNRVSLTGAVGQKIKASVTILPEEKYRFKIVGVEAKYGKHIRYSYSEIKADQGNGYLLTVENQKKEAGNYKDTIYLKTDSKIKPEIEVKVYGSIY